jgi:hypothetical protein
MIARLFNAPVDEEETNVMGTSTIGSSEVCDINSKYVYYRLTRTGYHGNYISIDLGCELTSTNHSSLVFWP